MSSKNNLHVMATFIDIMEKTTYTIHTLNKLDTFARRMSLKVTFISFEEKYIRKLKFFNQ